MSDEKVAKSALARQYVLDTIAQGETGDGSQGDGYSMLYGGHQFGDLSRHPDVHFNLGNGTHTSAAGRYQFLKPTWDEQAAKLGLKDFGPASQDSAAWNLAQETYKQKTGRDLEGDAQGQEVDWGALAGQWPSLGKRSGASAPQPYSGAEGSGTGGSYDLEVPDHQVARDANSLIAPYLLAQLSKSFHLQPVDYDPFEIQKKMVS